MPCAVPMVWKEPNDHTSNCYFCITNIKGKPSKSKHSVKYPNSSSAMRPVPHSQDHPVPDPPKQMTLNDDESSDEAMEKETKTWRFSQSVLQVNHAVESRRPE